MENNGQFPRDLIPKELELLLWILPDDRIGYKQYRQLVQSWKVIAQGRRGQGNYILAAPGEIADNESPLPQIFAQGVMITKAGTISVTLRERLVNQLEYEIDGLMPQKPAESRDEIRRWTFSTWKPSQTCPICEKPVREVQMKTERGRALTLALCATDHRLWVFDTESGVSHPIPLTNIYNELIIHKNIREPRIALDARRLFSDLNAFSDADLTEAFATYNMIRTKVRLDDRIVTQRPKKRSLFQRLFLKT